MEKIIPYFYISYGRYITQYRSLPLEIDCLKFVQRRLLLSLYDKAATKFMKSSTIIGHAMGTYHPHGDAGTYDALAKLVRSDHAKGQGNWGSRSIDGYDNYAAHRYCITGNSLVSTEKGLIPIKKLSNSENINLNIINYAGETKNANKYFKCDKFDILQIKTRFGYELSGSYNHPVLIINPNLEFEWKRLDQLQKEDHIAFKSTTNIGDDTIISDHKCRILGCLISEGSYANKKNHYELNNTNYEFIKDFEESIITEFPQLNYKFYNSILKSNKTLYSIQIIREHDKQFLLNNLQLINDYSKEKYIPEDILKTTTKKQAIFLKYLYDGDGSIIIGKRYSISIHYTSFSNKLLQELQQLLFIKFNIISSLKLNEHKLIIYGYTNCKKFHDQIGFLTHKQKKLEKGLSQFKHKNIRNINDIIPYISDYILNTYPKQCGIRTYIKTHYCKSISSLKLNWKILCKYLTIEDQNKIQNIINSEYSFLPIKEINKLPKDHVYSIRVDSECHSFIANGVVNHNTEAKLNKWVKELAFKYIKYVPWVEGELPNEEPLALPCPVPVGLVGEDCISGISFHSTLIPRYSISDLADRLYFILTTWQGNLYSINSVDIENNVELQESTYGPCIVPQIRGCTTRDLTKYNYYKLLTEGMASLEVIPMGDFKGNKINIYGCSPTSTFESLKRAIDDKKINIKRLIDTSGGKDDDERYNMHIIAETNNQKSEEVKKVVKQLWHDYLISNINFRCIFSNLEGKATNRGIDWLLLNNYYYYITAVKNKRLNDCIKLIDKKFNISIIKLIRQIIDNNNIKTLNDIITIFNNSTGNHVVTLETYENEQWNTVTKTITKEDIINVYSTKTIQRLIEVDTDIQKIDNEILTSKNKFSNTHVDCLQVVKDLI